MTVAIDQHRQRQRQAHTKGAAEDYERRHEHQEAKRVYHLMHHTTEHRDVNH